MITTIFSKSRPFNYILVISVLFLCFLAFHLQDTNGTNATTLIVKKIAVLILLIASILLTNFISRRNDLIKDNTFSLLFFFCFLILFSSAFNAFAIVLANFCVVLAIRRLISIRSLVTTKEKIFDASLLIFVASLFHFWSILFIILVFITIFFYVSRDYRNWIIPYIAFFTIAVLFVFLALLYDKTLLSNFTNGMAINFQMNYFANKYQNIALSVYAALSVLFLFSQIFSFSKKPMVLHATYKIILFSFAIGAAVFVISPNKNNAILLYTFMPMAIMATNYIENIEANWTKEITTILIIALSFSLYIFQL